MESVYHIFRRLIRVIYIREGYLLLEYGDRLL